MQKFFGLLKASIKLKRTILFTLILLTITISIIGKLPKGEAVSRNGAIPGDILYVTGQLGLSNIGLNHY